MQAIAHYALLGSLAAGIAGAVILALVTLLYGVRRRPSLAEGEEESAEQSTQRMRTARVADTLAVLCFAVAASLGAIGLTQQTRAPAEGPLADRLGQLETRLAGTESELHTHAPDLKAWEERLARLESRLGAMEERAAVADRRIGATEERVAAADRRAQSAEKLARVAERSGRDDRTQDATLLSPSLTPSPPPPVLTPSAVKPAPAAPIAAPPQGSPVAPDRPDASLKPEAAPAPAALPSSPSPPRASIAPPAKVDAPKHEASAAHVTPVPRRELPRAAGAHAAKPSEPTLGDKLRKDWDAIKRDAARGGDEWREGWAKLRRLFTP